MNSLGLIQHQFQDYLLGCNTEINDSILTTKDMSAEERLAIYKNAYRLRLIECLTTNFPGLHLFLGTEQFQQLCQGYIEHHPSCYRSIRWYGESLAGFIKNYYPNQYVYLPELADFEWKMTLSFDAKDAPVLLIEDMIKIHPEAWTGMTFILHPSLQRMDYFWNVIPVWRCLFNDEEDIPDMQCENHLTPWVMWRKQDYSIHYYSMSLQEAWALDAMNQGMSFSAICEGLCQWMSEDEVGMQAASYLKGWVQNGMISQVVFNGQ